MLDYTLHILIIAEYITRALTSHDTLSMPLYTHTGAV